MQANYDPETAALSWNSPAYHTTAIKWTSPVTSSLFLEAGYSNNTRVLHQQLPGRHREAARSPPSGSPTRRRTSSTSAATRRPRPTNTTRARIAFYWNAGGDVRHGRAHLQGRRPDNRGARSCTRVDANADLTQQYRSNTHRRAAARCPTACSSATRRCIYGERLNHDLGIYVQDSWRSTG